MTIEAIPPALYIFLAGMLMPFFRGSWRLLPVLLAPALLLALIWTAAPGDQLTLQALGMEIIPYRITTAGRLFATVFAIMLATGGIFALKTANTAELAAATIYGGAAIGATLSGDLISLFVYWEIMAVASTMVLWAAGTEKAWRASFRYALVHFMGGVILMAGITGHILETGSAEFTAMQADSIARWLILIGFLINAGAPPFSAWLPDAYPEASPSGTVFLSAFTTKTAVFVLLMGFPGESMLIWIGLYMVFYGIIYALLENDMRRILAYSIINQVGFMVTGIGIGTEMALNGAAAHAFAHIIYKGLLLMSAGVVLHRTGMRKCTDLGGLFRTMPVTTILGIIGALAISAFPFTSGFVTKSMISQAAADQGLAWAWFLLAAASAGVFLHAGIKFPWFVFFQKDSGLRPKDAPAEMKTAMYIFAFLCIAIGIYPAPLYAALPFSADYVPYTASHLVFQFQLLLFAGLAFFLMLPLMKRTLTITLDFDWFYRRFMTALAREFSLRGGLIRQRSIDAAMKRLYRFQATLERTHGPQGIIARTWPIGSTVLWVALLLGIYVLVYYL